MRIIPVSAFAAMAFAALGFGSAPAFGQAVIRNFSFPELKQQLIDLKSTIKKESETEEKIRFIEAEDADGLIYAVYGLECDSKEPTQRCRGAEMVASFKLERDGEINKALDLIDYAAVADYKGTDNRLKLSRYVIFDDGITPANFKVNITVFTNIANEVWDMLEEEGFFEKPNAAAAEPKAIPGKPTATGQVESTGSGFFITAAGHLLTNAHVVEGCTPVSLVSGSRLTVLDIDLGSDLALLKMDGTSTHMPLLLRQGRGVRLADSVVVAGYPLTGLLSSGLNVTTGAVSALAGPEDDRRLIQITAPVQPGNSGGPLLDTSGNVVGVVVSKLDALKVASITGDIPQNVNFAVSLGTLQAFLDSNGVDYETRASSSAKSNADVAELARAATVQIQCRN